MSDPLPSRTRPRGTEALGVQPGEMFEGQEFIEQTTAPTGAVFLFLGLFALAVAAGVIVASRS